MKMAEAMKIIEGRPKGFRVYFEKVQGGFLYSDHFPDRDEELISTEVEAWRLANSFAARTRARFVNIYVIDQNFGPVEGYEDKEIHNR